MTPAVRAGRIALGLASGALGGALLRWLHVPLPWLIGPLIAMALLRLFNAPVDGMPAGRQMGQGVIGVAVGLYFSADVVRQVLTAAPIIVLASIGTLLMGAVTSLLLARLAQIDLKTAYFCSMPGGVAEMAVLGDRFGAHPGAIALSQSLRVAVIVVTVPPAVSALSHAGAMPWAPVAREVIWPALILMLAAGYLASWLFSRARINNAWLLGALATGITIGVLDLRFSDVPLWLVSLAQILLGSALGARFSRNFLIRAPRFALATAFCSLVLVVLSTGLGSLAGLAMGLPETAAILATAPGSIGEMSVTARVLGIAVPMVTAFQLVRIVVVVLLSGPFFQLCRAAGLRWRGRFATGD